MSYGNVFYLFVYFLVILYYVILGCWMFAYSNNPISTRGEQEAKLRMTRSVGAFMFLWALEYLMCLPPMLRFCDNWHPIYKLIFITQTMLHTPMLYVVIRAILQKWQGTLQGAGILASLFMVIDIWFIFFDWDGKLPATAAGVLCIVCVVGYIVRYVKDYRSYVCRLRSEYSETTNRDILWSCWSFMGIAVQILVYLFYESNWSMTLEVVYTGMSIINAAYICYCTRQQKPMDNDVVTENMEKTEKAFYGIIEQKLEVLCEKKLLFLEPNLTRETLCLRLSIGRTYLSMYLNSRGLNFYQYINSLRVEYAIKLMRDNPHMPINEVCKLSGFRSQTTFRKVFQEVMGCLPSEFIARKNNYE